MIQDPRAFCTGRRRGGAGGGRRRVGHEPGWPETQDDLVGVCLVVGEKEKALDRIEALLP